jgi:hypothetical protein
MQGLKDWGEDEWSSDGDRKGSASTLSCYESKWTDSEDEGKDDKPVRAHHNPHLSLQEMMPSSTLFPH